jgi:hypothetical protein
LSWELLFGWGVREGRREEEERNARSSDLALVFGGEEKGEVDFKHGLEQTHVGALIETDLVFPDVDDQHLGDGDGEEGRFALKVLVGKGAE